MLSRTAEGLFWLGRYMERADNLARLVDAGRRLDLTAGKAGTSTNEWAAILIAAGCSTTYPGAIDSAGEDSAVPHLVQSMDNPSCIRACFDLARANARAQRGAITSEVWSVANEAWRATRDLTPAACGPRRLPETLDQVRSFAAHFRGAVEGTMLRDERYGFLRLGQMVERADATARIVDVKYHVLMPAEHPIGSAMDQLQWNTLLRASGARSSYRWVYNAPVSANLVVDFLLLNRASPRSMRFALESASDQLSQLHQGGAHGKASLTAAKSLRDGLRHAEVDTILASGLHEYLTTMIVETNKLAIAIASDFGFGPISAQSQAME